MSFVPSSTPPSSTTGSSPPAPADAAPSTLRLSPHEIPSTWTRPAEVLSTRPEPARRRPLGLLALVGSLAAGAIAAVVLLKPANVPVPVPVPAPALAPVPAPRVAPAPPPPIPAPPPTSSTQPAAVAPEDQGAEEGSAGENLEAKVEADVDANVEANVEAKVEAKVDQAEAEKALSPSPRKVEGSGGTDVVSELPARKKAKALTAKAIASLRDGDFAGAEPVLVRAVLIDPTYSDAWRHLGIARAQMGDREGARRAYRKYLALAPRAPDAAQVRQILAQ